MEKAAIGLICKVTATTSAGLFAGSALGSNFTAMPAMMKIEDTASLRVGWKHHFLLGKAYMGRCAQLSFLAGCSACYLDNTETKYYWLAGAASMFFIFPYTALVMFSDIQKLLKDDVISTRGVDWVRASINTWDKRHFKRSMAGAIGFGIFLYALYNRT
ncbi:uncharacterized protein LOC132559166 [Ylistrum balloti]|uniref:uncharacterized protein LOC132559166 n=1 Tax=Ylistrum balloti TaxID=509963 RepID=UPI0029059DC3|nr:uncharacterized protein LOC132559166 [Ylistrum balloti]